jgi:hypothetical protein
MQSPPFSKGGIKPASNQAQNYFSTTCYTLPLPHSAISATVFVILNGAERSEESLFLFSGENKDFSLRSERQKSLMSAPFPNPHTRHCKPLYGIGGKTSFILS